ncbi:MAG: hypothetical protein IPN76_06635 [Saprospiraceae bacterium]|nr:hypothetical protein [Saprospiraceae bacterium]
MQYGMTDHVAPGMMHFFTTRNFHHDGPEFIELHVSEFLLDLPQPGLTSRTVAQRKLPGRPRRHFQGRSHAALQHLPRAMHRT